MRAVSRGRTAAAVMACAVAAAGLLAATLTPAAAAQPTADTAVTQSFSADSGDLCRYGYTEGTLGWNLEPLGGAVTSVDVTGFVRDLPLAVGDARCGDDGRYSVALVTALAGGTAVDSVVTRADNGISRFAARLAGSTRAVQIDRVVVRVCRPSPAPSGPVYCGADREFRPPVA